MRPEEQRRLGVEWLTNLGVPASFRDPIIDAPKGSIASWFLLGFLLFATILSVEVGVVLWLGGHAQERALALAAETGATLTHLSYGFGSFVLWLGLMALMLSVTGGLAGRRRVAGFLSFFGSYDQPPPPAVAPT